MELIERFDKWQGKVEALEAENVELRADNVKLKARFKNLKLKVKSLEKMVQSKGEETCEQVELNNSSSKKKRSVAASSKKSPTTSTSKNSRALTKPLPTSCRDLRAQGHFADGIYLLADLAKNQIMAYFCEFLSAVDSKISTLKYDFLYFIYIKKTLYSFSC